MSLSRHDAEALARLAHLRLPSERVDEIVAQLEQLLGWLASLQDVDVEGVPEMDGLTLAAVPLRADVAGAALDRDAALAMVPEVDDGQVVVPRFVEE
ncbi:MAG TPA: Asp-tRNA(Asn)/Glu-tRNA(Gln) amidotransferase subunit GatC [Nannocystaceae bacterium]|nr:Asp-tRNA(Asn)/Glu-tRNA(Gln) amidotransferase subunit GatC [Nannocystaceae bacterium]